MNRIYVIIVFILLFTSTSHSQYFLTPYSSRENIAKSNKSSLPQVLQNAKKGFDWDVEYSEAIKQFSWKDQVGAILETLNTFFIEGNYRIDKLSHISINFLIPTALIDPNFSNRAQSILLLIGVGEILDIELTSLFKLIAETEKNPFVLDILSKTFVMLGYKIVEIIDEPDSSKLAKFVSEVDVVKIEQLKQERIRIENAKIFEHSTGLNISDISSYRQLLKVAKKAAEKDGGSYVHYIDYYLDGLPYIVSNRIISKVILPLSRKSRSHKRDARAIIERSKFKRKGFSFRQFLPLLKSG